MTSNQRLATLDAMRAIAASLVLASHYGIEIAPPLYWFENNVWNIGVTGVFVFFCVSGYVIPLTLGSINPADGRWTGFLRFWIRRAFRLLPLYLVLMVPAWLVFGAASPAHLDALTAALANSPMSFTLSTLTFTAYFFDKPMAFGGLEWTLAYEFCFYVACSAFILAGKPNNIRLLYSLIAFLCLALFVREKVAGTQKFFFMFTFFLLGTITFLKQSGQIDTRVFAWAAAVLVAMIDVRVVLWASRWGVSYLTLAGVLAPPIFLAGTFLMSKKASGMIAPIGVISYSIYLSHMLVPRLAPLDALPSPLRIVCWIAADFAVSFALYKLIEAPCVTLGSRLLSRLRTSKVATPAV